MCIYTSMYTIFSLSIQLLMDGLSFDLNFLFRTNVLEGDELEETWMNEISC